MTVPSPRPKRRWLWIAGFLGLLLIAALQWRRSPGRELEQWVRQLRSAGLQVTDVRDYSRNSPGDFARRSCREFAWMPVSMQTIRS
jgi:hypothetical protein